METIYSIVDAIGDITFTPLLILMLGGGIFLTVFMRGYSLYGLRHSINLIRQSQGDSSQGEIQPRQALFTALSATVGVGNIAGVATAIHLGGPGALFWMWVIALFGIATKFSEAVLAVHYREIDERGAYVGGPMYYIKHGLKKYRWAAGLATAFAFFGLFAGFGAGNSIQVTAIANALGTTGIASKDITPILAMILVVVPLYLVIIGGVRRIAAWASALVPFMSIAYLTIALLTILLSLGNLGDAFAQIFAGAFGLGAAAGGFTGAALIIALQMGVQRGILSNESGLGSAAIAHAAAKTDDPIRQGTIGMFGVVIDTLIICTCTGLAIVATGAYEYIGEDGNRLTGVALTSHAMVSQLGEWVKYVLTLAVMIFAFTTLIGWSYYCERCFQYINGVKNITRFRLAWVIVAGLTPLLLLGGEANQVVGLVWRVADVLNTFMAIPNMIALLMLSGTIYGLLKASSWVGDKSENGKPDGDSPVKKTK